MSPSTAFLWALPTPETGAVKEQACAESRESSQVTCSPCLHPGSGYAESAHTMLMRRRWRCEHVVPKPPVQVPPAVSGELLKSLLQSRTGEWA